MGVPRYDGHQFGFGVAEVAGECCSDRGTIWEVVYYEAVWKNQPIAL
jgi:hypothetical protein